jgi:hypothetical protein
MWKEDSLEVSEVAREGASGGGSDAEDWGVKEGRMSVATCAMCGKQRELCGSCRVEGVQEPRVCKECLILSMKTGEWETNKGYWIKQMEELGDRESLVNLVKRIEEK